MDCSAIEKIEEEESVPAHAMQAKEGGGFTATFILTLGTGWGKWPALLPGRFTIGESNLSPIEYDVRGLEL